MITVKITSERKLDTPDDIAAYLTESQDDTSRGAYHHGEVVAIANRSGLPPEIGVGDVALVLFSEPSPSPYTSVRLLHSSGSIMTMQVQTANLAKRNGEGA
ncbi:hypothetical protein G3T14_21790 [Methylobacterium sp. BTF04]|uniref:hypothetical protein n=1 Tax=Methylobacterium sp. BTF04 TaxID=2708300 RepID=UPI0013D49F61|nr:hypothetical protein [Methylobacterium sp. BTF04]NEU14715.1 hypothetical protein [Methylobacterium sp. BTF04]